MAGPQPPAPSQRRAESTVFVVVLVASMFGASLLGPATPVERVANGIVLGFPFGVLFGGVASLIVALGRFAPR